MLTPPRVEAFVSILIGLALADIAHSLHKLLRARRVVHWDPLTIMAALLVTASVVNMWWSLDAVFSHAVTFAAFVPNLASLLLLFLLAGATLPDHVPDEGIDLKVYYLDNRAYFWGLFGAWILAIVVNEALTSLEQGVPVPAIIDSIWPNLPFVAIAGLLMWTRRRWVHGVVLVFCLVVLVGNWVFDTSGKVRPNGQPPAAAPK